MKNYKMYIGGEWVDSASGETFESLNPFTTEAWALIPRGNKEDVEKAVTAAQNAFENGEWRKMSASKRGGLLRKLGDLFSRDAELLARIETLDNGKPISDTLGQTRYLPEYFYYFGGLADKIEGTIVPVDKAEMFAFTRREPLGVCAAITPWNSPLMLAVWKLAPGLAAGNTFVLKPSEYTSATALELARLIEEAGFPPGVVNVLTGFGSEVGDPLINDPRVAKISFTGGPVAGKRVAEAAARGSKRVTLELGGKSPNIVFDDADLDNAIKGVAAGIFGASGQMCIAGSRLLIQKSIQEEFISKLSSFVSTIKMGDPLDPTTQMGPVATKPQFKKILEGIKAGKEEGANCVLGGKAAEFPECGKGWFIEPTIFNNANNQMHLAREEIFGPVLTCIPFEDENDAITIANDSPYGLASGVWSQNISRVLKMSERLQAGTVWINTYRVASYLMPAGGYKESGLGRENGIDAVNDYLQTKSVWVGTGEMPDPFILR